MMGHKFRVREIGLREKKKPLKVEGRRHSIKLPPRRGTIVRLREIGWAHEGRENQFQIGKRATKKGGGGEYIVWAIIQGGPGIVSQIRSRSTGEYSVNGREGKCN